VAGICRGGQCRRVSRPGAICGSYPTGSAVVFFPRRFLCRQRPVGSTDAAPTGLSGGGRFQRHPLHDGVPGGSPLEFVSPQSAEPLLPLPPLLYTANILAVGLPRALAGVPDTWRAPLAVPERLTQQQLVTAAHVAAARAMCAPLSICARARWAATGAQMEAAVRLCLGVAPVPLSFGHDCRCGLLADSLGCHWLGGCSRSVPLRTFRHKAVLQRVSTVLRVYSQWTEVVAEPPLPVGAQAPALRPDLQKRACLSERRCGGTCPWWPQRLLPTSPARRAPPVCLGPPGCAGR